MSGTETNGTETTGTAANGTAGNGTGENYVADLALRWARTDALEQWVNAAPGGGRTPVDETVREYLGAHNPFPDETAVEVLRNDGSGWDRAVIVERVGVDEWTVEYEDGEQAWRDHHELRPAPASPASQEPASTRGTSTDEPAS